MDIELSADYIKYKV